MNVRWASRARRGGVLRGAALALLAALSLPPAGALAHEEGVIRLDPERAAAGSRITIQGEELGDEVRLKLRLEGVLQTHDWTEVVTAEDGTFRITFALPEAARPGRYTVVAVAPDGDEVARAVLEIVAALDAGEAGAASDRPSEATDAAMPIDSQPGPVEWAVILGFVLACGIGGLALLRAGGG